MNPRRGLFQTLAVLALLATTGGCELMKHVRIQTDDRNPNSFVKARAEGPRGAQDRMELEFRLWPYEASD